MYKAETGERASLPINVHISTASLSEILITYLQIVSADYEICYVRRG